MLRLDRVTLLDQGEVELNHLCLNIYAGEIMGIVPVNGTGLEALARILRQNVPIHYGFVYYRGKLVNDWRNADLSYNRIGIIEGRSGLADDLTVTDNVFVLRPGFRKRYISPRVLSRQLRPFLRDIGVEIPPDARARDLSTFERYVIELVKAVVAGSRLIMMIDAGTVVSDSELIRLHGIMRHYAAQGISFLCSSPHYEEIRQIADRTALMMNGQIAKVVGTDTPPEVLSSLVAAQFQTLVESQTGRPSHSAHPAIRIDELWYGAIAGLSLSIAPAECVVLQDLDDKIIDDLVMLMAGGAKPDSGTIHVDNGRDDARDVAVIQKLAPKTMLFPELSYLDNLCFTMDHRLPHMWMRAKSRASIRRECEAWVGKSVFNKTIEELTQMEKYDLIYARVLLQRPKVVFCVQPFMQADVEHRMHIWRLLERLLQKGIAVVILAMNLADTLSLADRLIQMKDGKVIGSYARREFAELPASVPWRYLWHDSARPTRR